MDSLKQLGAEYLESAFKIRIQLEKLKLERSLPSTDPDSFRQLNQRIDCLYLEYLHTIDIGNKLIIYYEKKGKDEY